MRRYFFAVVLGILLTNSCDQEFKPLVNCAESGLRLELDALNSASGCSTFDGSIHVRASGGEEPYQFSIDDVVFQADGNFTGVQTGIYTVSVTDANGCQAFINNVHVEAEGFAVSAMLKSDSICQGGNGAATILVTQGDGPFTYKIGNGPFTDNNTFTGLNEGNHKITVKDGNDCTVALTVTIPHGFSGVSWSSDVRLIIATNCALSGCHNGITHPDLRIYSKAKFYAALIREYTQNGTMPFDGTLTQQEIDLIACWVDDGALDN